MSRRVLPSARRALDVVSESRLPTRRADADTKPVARAASVDAAGRSLATHRRRGSLAPTVGRYTIAVVGNGPLDPGSAVRIADADLVVRFNDCRGFEAEAGARLDMLFLVNRGGQAAEWLADPRFTRRRAIRRARRIVLPIHPDVESPRRPEIDDATHAIDARDHTRALSAALEAIGKPVTVLSHAHYRASVGALGLHRSGGDWRVPSTGLLAMRWLLPEGIAGRRLELHGFGFDGWSGHPWTEERAWATAAEDRGELILHPSPG